jgi:predicted amino acid racemase
LDIGREDVDVTGLQPLDTRLAILGASSDHLLVDVTAAEGTIRVGDEIAFALNYSALLAAMTSGYVDKRPLHATTAEKGKPCIIRPVM